MSPKNQRVTNFIYAVIAFVLTYLILQAYYFGKTHSLRVIDWRNCTEARQQTNDVYIINCLEYK